MSSEQVVTASSIWPIYLKLKESILQNNNNPRYTCDLTLSEDQDNYGDTEELFPTASQCALSTGEITSYLNNNEVDKTNNSDEETCGNVINDTSSDTTLNHLEDHIKRAIKTPLFKRYDSVQARPILQKISFLDPRYRSHYIELSQKDLIIRLIKQEMDDIGHQVEVDKHDENKNIGS